MGYDTTRFIGEVDEEFHCSICSMVLEDPIQTPCDHSFCNECINQWLRLNAICPVDRQPLAITDLKPPSRLMRNLLAKMKMKCDFEQRGCSSIILFEHLHDHLTTCRYNPDLDQDAEIICDKGCNLKMTRRECNRSNCLTHFAKRLTSQQEENIKLTHELNNQRECFQNALNQQGDQIKKLVDEVNRLKKLTEEGNGNGTSIDEVQPNLLYPETSSLHGPSVSFSVDCPNPTSLISPTSLRRRLLSTSRNRQQTKDWRIKWREVNDMTISKDQPSILKSNEFGAFAQLCYFLAPSDSRFKVEIMKEGTYSIGHVGIGLSTSQVIGRESITYYSYGFVTGDDDVPTFDVGDIIECGIDFNVDGSNNVEVYFCKNGVLIVKKLVKMPRDGFYPSIWMSGINNKIKYSTN